MICEQNNFQSTKKQTNKREKHEKNLLLITTYILYKEYKLFTRELYLHLECAMLIVAAKRQCASSLRRPNFE